MIDILEKNHQPNIMEISEYIDNPLFDELCAYLQTQCKALWDMAYSGDAVLLGWNVRFSKAGKTLCRLYPRKGKFAVLVVVGRKEKSRVEALLPQMSRDMQNLYAQTKEGMGQRWLVMELNRRDALYNDLLAIVDIRRKNG